MRADADAPRWWMRMFWTPEKTQQQIEALTTPLEERLERDRRRVELQSVIRALVETEISLFVQHEDDESDDDADR